MHGQMHHVQEETLFLMGHLWDIECTQTVIVGKLKAYFVKILDENGEAFATDDGSKVINMGSGFE